MGMLFLIPMSLGKVQKHIYNYPLGKADIRTQSKVSAI
jgi:hypothetical protein